MFVSLSKSIGKFGSFRLGIGKRLTTKNAWWLLIVLVFVVTFQLAYYMLLASLWLIYAMFYGIYWCFKKIIQGVIKLFKHIREKNVGE